MPAEQNSKFWQWGAEHELADVDRHRKLPKGYGWDVRDVTIVNSNGIANDPKGELYGFGGEINTPPTDTIAGQIECLEEIRELFPEARVNYRSNLHIHIRVPGLQKDLEALKRVHRYVHVNMPKAFPLIEHLVRPTIGEFKSHEELQGALRRWRRRRVSHQSLLTAKRLEHQLAAPSIEAFFDREPPYTKAGKPMWHAQPRLCVSLRQLLQTDTVEFRHFPGTLSPNELRKCFSWCNKFMQAALQNHPIEGLLSLFRREDFPQFPKYVHWQELRYRETVHDGTRTREQIKAAIKAILADEFDDYLGSVSR